MEKEKKVITHQEILREKGEFKANGIIKNISGEISKVYKSGWVGNSIELVLQINDTKQKIKIFGGDVSHENKITVFQKDSEGKIMKDANNKSIMLKIKPSEFSDENYITFDKKEVLEWGERTSDGANKITHISELTAGRFAKAIMEKKDMLIGKKVSVRGSVSFKPTMNFDKIEANMDVSSITILASDEENLEKNHFFIMETPIIIPKPDIDKNLKEGKIFSFVPIYHKYLKPIIKDGKEQKGRNVFVPMYLDVEDNGFMGLPKGLFSVEDRGKILISKIEQKTYQTDISVMRAMLVYKSGMVERDIEVSDLVDDPVYSTFAKQALSEQDEAKREEECKKVKELYKATNPSTIKGEFKQKIDFCNITQDRESSGDKIAGITWDLVEKYTLEQIKKDTEMMENNAPKEDNKSSKVEIPSNKTSNIPAPENIPTGIGDFDDDEFPF